MKSRLSGKAPQPLRGEIYPWEFAWLTGLDLIKVLTANREYVKVGRILKRAQELQIYRAVENPRSSYVWHLEPYRDLLFL